MNIRFQIPDDYESRLIDMEVGGLSRLRLLAFERHDLVPAKLARNTDRDREDVVALALGPGLDTDVADLTRDVKTPVLRTAATSPTWSADGTRLLFGMSTTTTQSVLGERDAGSAGPTKTIYQENGLSALRPFDETRDGRLVVFGRMIGRPSAASACCRGLTERSPPMSTGASRARKVRCRRITRGSHIPPAM